jgi:hypothetical protein
MILGDIEGIETQAEEAQQSAMWRPSPAPHRAQRRPPPHRVSRRRRRGRSKDRRNGGSRTPRTRTRRFTAAGVAEANRKAASLSAKTSPANQQSRPERRHCLPALIGASSISDLLKEARRSSFKSPRAART